MTIQQQFAANLKDAMRSRDKSVVNVIRQIESEIGLKKSTPGFAGGVDDDLYLTTIAAYVKKMRKAQGEFEAAGDRGADQAAKLQFEIDYLAQWLPRAVGEATTRQLVRAAIAELGVEGHARTGQVIGHLMKSHSNLDGGLVSQIVREELKS